MDKAKKLLKKLLRITLGFVKTEWKFLTIVLLMIVFIYEVDKLHDRVSRIQRDIDSIQSDVSSIQSDVSSIETYISIR
jgi:sensor domain CHASE-containing protein